jgi:SAM-dependent methyltransferase
MHGAVHDYVVLVTIKDGLNYPSGETTDGGSIKDYVDYTKVSLELQPTYRRILEIGSLDICGSLKTYDYINRGPKWIEQVGCEEYVGLDLIPGNCVDLIANAHDIPLDSNSFDLVMCSNMLEHDSDPQKTILEAYRCLKPGQPFILTTVNQNWDVHPQLGGGDTETFNRITIAQFEKWLAKPKFRTVQTLEWKNNLFAYCLK